MSTWIASVTEEQFAESVYARSRSYNSKNRTKFVLKQWKEFLQSQNLDHTETLAKLRQIQTQPECYLFLNNYIQYWQVRGHKTKTLRNDFYYIKLWLRANGIRINSDDVKQFVQFPKPIKELRKPLTMDKIQLLLKESGKKLRGLLYLLLSSGLRVSEALQLRVLDIDFRKNPVEIHIRAITTKGREERMAFMSAECAELLKEIIQGKELTDYVFVKAYNDTTTMQVEHRFAVVRKRCGLDAKYGNGYNYHVNIHSFRAYFHTQATRVLGGDVAHALIGHHKYLDQYFRLTQEERADQYRQLEPYLTTSNENRLKIELEKKEVEIESHKLLEQKVLELEAKLKRANI